MQSFLVLQAMPYKPKNIYCVYLLGLQRFDALPCAEKQYTFVCVKASQVVINNSRPIVTPDSIIRGHPDGAVSTVLQRKDTLAAQPKQFVFALFTQKRCQQ